ncbi:NAD(P)H-hydrate dehydratase [Ruegeria sp. Ofav3-42]|uniref:NAD(P)H-hydrate dehydratase n=1 Tax=Ruegeria sp. Ofav3-42 TaxID=2917759 RepID=UPI001EF4CF17|nr:NAD(P)H-hydrate dehydratase [Ruegeria sp. Ofav3-42]MCG7521300.1 NAD(P)H-hydrate dehydratase [Ruegeria sp. Ofav3-42]
MAELLTAAQMRAVEQAAIESGQVTGLELMERAGRGVVEAVFEEWPELSKTSGTAVVLCGPGNNGGDGFVVARLLKEWGWEVEVYLYGDPKKLPPDARTNYERWKGKYEVNVLKINPPPLVDDYLKFPPKFDLLIDGLFGTGLTRPFQGIFTLLASEDARCLMRQHGARVVAIDVPSGLCADSGRVLGNVITADLTVTFHGQKVGHLIGVGPETCGLVRTKPIGLQRQTSKEVVQLVSDRVVPWTKATMDHKYSHGHALILSGGSGKTGAARLAARGALRIGAGLVTLGVPPAAQLEAATEVTAIMLRRLEDGDVLTETLKDERLNALCLGPGLGLDRARDLVPVALAVGRSTVLDADALTAFADDPSVLFDMLHENCVLTPHGGEFARLFPDISEKLKAVLIKGPAYSKVDATRDAAKRAGCVVLFKGPNTVIAAPDGRCAVNSAHYERSAPWLATAGSGDVLAGFITGLMARGFDPMPAAETAAWLHVECARSFGPGLIAEDLPEQLPQVFQQMSS